MAAQYSAVAKAVRPNNIGLGYWNKMRAPALDGITKQASKLSKVSNVLAGIAVGIQVLEGVGADINRGYSVDRIVSNAIANTAIYGVTTFGLGAIGAKVGGMIGTFIPVPIVGTVIGTAIGFALGIGFGMLLDLNVEGKSIIDHFRDEFYDFVKGFLWF